MAFSVIYPKKYHRSKLSRWLEKGESMKNNKTNESGEQLPVGSEAVGYVASVTRRGSLDMQVCIPKEWDDYMVVEFAEKENPCGSSCGWVIRREGSENLAGSAERVQCSQEPDNVHITLDA